MYFVIPKVYLSNPGFTIGMSNTIKNIGTPLNKPKTIFRLKKYPKIKTDHCHFYCDISETISRRELKLYILQ